MYASPTNKFIHIRHTIFYHTITILLPKRQEGLLLISQAKPSFSLIPDKGSLLIYVGLLKQNLRVWVYLSSGVCISLGNLGYIALNREKKKFPRGHWEKIKHETLGSCPLQACLFPFQPSLVFVSDCSFDYIITSSLGAQLLYFFTY